MAVKTEGETMEGLGSHVYLEKQDKLRDIGIDIETSQIVAVGSQSSGKSSLLESLTGFAFPRGQGLCTRYATQISLRRSHVSSIIISITPRTDADPELKNRLRAFRCELDSFSGKGLGSIIEDANQIMGIRTAGNDDPSLSTFSDDILKVEISGPEHPYLTVIDVPGLFEVAAGKTTHQDKAMIERMVKRYMAQERTIILAVMSSLSDPDNEKIFEFAKEADPRGERTLGVLTKADLVTEKRVCQNIVNFVQGDSLKLGYFVVCNRGADDDNSSVAECRQKEKDFFARPDWVKLVKLARAGVEPLRNQLQVLLTSLAKREFPKQRAEISKRLAESKKKLEEMGLSRSDASGQRQYLTNIASRFEHIVRDALTGRYDGEEVFVKFPHLKLITKILELNQGFSDMMTHQGHTRPFQLSDNKPEEQSGSRHGEYERALCDVFSNSLLISELREIIEDEEYICPKPMDRCVMEHIAESYRTSRGPELGTFGGSLLTTIFREQTKNWRYIVIFHVQAVIATVHQFIKALLMVVVEDERIREELWQNSLFDQLASAYSKAIAEAEKILDVELQMPPSTWDRAYYRGLDEVRLKRDNGVLVNNVEAVKQDLADNLQCYYEIARKRIVDNVCRQVIDALLLLGPNSPPKILNPMFIAEMNEEKLENIAGEDPFAKRDRQRLEFEIAGLKEAIETVFRK